MDEKPKLDLSAWATELQKALAPVMQALAAQGVMGLAYSGEAKRVVSVLADMTDEHLAKVVSAAEMVVSAGDEVAYQRRRGNFMGKR